MNRAATRMLVDAQQTADGCAPGYHAVNRPRTRPTARDVKGTRGDSPIAEYDFPRRIVEVTPCPVEARKLAEEQFVRVTSDQLADLGREFAEWE